MSKWDTINWAPNSASRVWIYTLEADDCSFSASCMSNRRKKLQYKTTVKNDVRRRFSSLEELTNGLASFVEFQDTHARQASTGDSIVLQISVHGKDFAHLEVNGHVVDLFNCVMAINNRLTDRTVVLLNQCWGGWPTWARLFRQRNGSPRFIFGSVKRHDTSAAALNSAEATVLDWLRGKTAVRHPLVIDVVRYIHGSILPQFPGHEECYRVWYWEGGQKQSYPPAQGQRVGMPDP